MWNGSFFAHSDLDSVDLAINLGHGGHLCPGYLTAVDETLQEADGNDSDWDDLDDEEEPPEDGGMLGLTPIQLPEKKPAEAKVKQCMIFVDVTGVFRRQIKPCLCPNAHPLHLQLFQMELFSATITKPSTAFTF